jgi:hypothetical protein
MNTTPAKKEFKKRFGQANHFLITTLVGIDGIKSGQITEKPASFSTSWNPIDPKRSAERSRVFVLKSFLAWAVESLEMYMTELNRKPKLLESEQFTILYSRAGQSVYKKTIFIADEVQVDPILIALMEVLITWRNYTFHYDIDNEIRDSSLNCLLNKSDEVKSRFAGLDITQLKKTWETGGDFTFKEAASLIKATQDFVSEIDKYILNNIDFERFFFETIEKHFVSSPHSKLRFRSFDSTKKKKYLKILMQNIAGENNFDENIISNIIDKLNEK